MKQFFLLFSLLLIASSCRAPEEAKATPQHPSPMVDYTRPHHRTALDSVPNDGIAIKLSEDLQGKLYAPAKWKTEKSAALLLHFHGDYRAARRAVDQENSPWILFHCHWGGFSSAYGRPIQNLNAKYFLDTILSAVQKKLPETQTVGVYLSAWSAGYGAVRNIISDQRASERIDGILLLDGLHCSYVPEGKPMAQGGVLDADQMQAFLNWAELATHSEKSFVLTHSSVFPGTYASTTETADYLLQRLNIARRSLLKQGPVGMQQTSEAVRGKLKILSFAGNSAPDHVDHYHGMGAFLRELR